MDGDFHLTKIPYRYHRNVFRHKEMQKIHHQVIDLFDCPTGERNQARKQYGILFRVQLEHQPHILIKSDIPPTKIIEDNTGIQTKAVKLFDRIITGGQVTYYISIDPIVTQRKPTGKYNTVYDRVLGFDKVKEWWTRKAETNGLLVKDVDISRKWSYHTITGTGTVTDRDILINALRKGIGRSKDRGSGFLTTLPVNT